MFGSPQLTRQSGTSKFWSRVVAPTRRQLALAVVAIAAGLQLADIGLDLGELVTSGDADLANIVSVGDFLFGCVATILFRR